MTSDVSPSVDRFLNDLKENGYLSVKNIIMHTHTTTLAMPHVFFKYIQQPNSYIF